MCPHPIPDIYTRDEPELIFTLAFPAIPSSQFPFTLIPIPKLKSYSHSHKIPIPDKNPIPMVVSDLPAGP